MKSPSKAAALSIALSACSQVPPANSPSDIFPLQAQAAGFGEKAPKGEPIHVEEPVITPIAAATRELLECTLSLHDGKSIKITYLGDHDGGKLSIDVLAYASAEEGDSKIAAKLRSDDGAVDVLEDYHGDGTLDLVNRDGEWTNLTTDVTSADRDKYEAILRYGVGRCKSLKKIYVPR